jgi:hypothetical protein
MDRMPQPIGADGVAPLRHHRLAKTTDELLGRPGHGRPARTAVLSSATIVQIRLPVTASKPNTVAEVGARSPVEEGRWRAASMSWMSSVSLSRDGARC